MRVLFAPLANCFNLPTRAHHDDAGFDLYAANIQSIRIFKHHTVLIPLGFKMAIEEGYEAQIRPRSGLAGKHHIIIPNSPGTVDAGYRGEVLVLLRNIGFDTFVVEPGMRIAQMVFHKLPSVEVQIINEGELPESLRGEGGVGHTGL